MVHVINNIEYVLIKIPVSNSEKKLDKAIEKYQCIVHDFEIIRNNLTISSFLFGTTKVKISILVPSKHIKEFQEEFFK